MGQEIPAEWRLHAETDGPLFGEYVGLCASGGWKSIFQASDCDVGPQDALIVVDMQNDFVPVDVVNKDGGAFSVPEGVNVSPLIVQLMQRFCAAGATVVATRDYHPRRHVSFLPQGGPFPAHCVQGSEGSKFYRPIGDALFELRRAGGRVAIVFKGFHESVDSFGGFAYPDSEETYKRVSWRKGCNKLHGCSHAAWTGSVSLECSNLEDDINAPPDILAHLSKVDLATHLRAEGVKRVFVCGLALDYCVLDTCLNARAAGFEHVSMVLDAARAAHLPPGIAGSGFLQDPRDLCNKMSLAGVVVRPSAALLLDFVPRGILAGSVEVRKTFPEQLGPFALVPAKTLALELDLVSLTYRATEPAKVVAEMEALGVDCVGKLAKLCPVTLDPVSRRAAGIPESATQFTWCYPVAGAINHTDQQRAYFATQTPSTAFLVYGGFVYIGERGEVVGRMAIAPGEGLQFREPQHWPPTCTSGLKEDRWRPVTVPFLREKGVAMFAWISPGEWLVPSDGGGNAAKPLQVGGLHGAFAYRHKEDITAADPRDCFFQVAVNKPGIAACGRVSVAEGSDLAEKLRRASNRTMDSDTAKSKVLELFKEWDVNSNGRLTQAEMVRSIQRLNPSLKEESLVRLFQEADQNKDGHVVFSEFLQWLFDGEAA